MSARRQIAHHIERFCSWTGVVLAFGLSTSLLVLSVRPLWYPLCVAAGGVVALVGWLFQSGMRGALTSTRAHVVVVVFWLIALLVVRFSIYLDDTQWGAALLFTLGFGGFLYLLRIEAYPEYLEQQLPQPILMAFTGGCVGAGLTALLPFALLPQDGLLVGSFFALWAALVATALSVHVPTDLPAGDFSLRSLAGALLRRHGVLRIQLAGAFFAFGLLCMALVLAAQDYHTRFASTFSLARFLGVAGICLFVFTSALWLIFARLARREWAGPVHFLCPALLLAAFVWWTARPSLISATALLGASFLGLLGTAIPLWRASARALSPRLRSPATALVLGIGGTGGVMIYGVVLFVLQSLPDRLLGVIGVLSAAGYLLLSYFERRGGREEWALRLKRGFVHPDLHIPEAPPTPSTDEMIRALRSEDPLSAQIALSTAALASKPERYLPVIEPLLRDPLIPPVRLWARRYLASLSRSDQLRLLQGDSSVRAHVIAADGEGDLLSAEEYLDDPSPRVRALASVHGMLRGSVAAASVFDDLMPIDDDILLECLEMLPERVPEALQRRIKKLIWHPSPAVRLEAMRALDRLLSSIGEGQADLLETALSGATHESAEVRALAAGLLAKTGASNAPEHLARLLEDRADLVRDRAAEGLASLRKVGVGAARSLLEAEEETTQVAACKVIAASGSAGAGVLREQIVRMEEILKGYRELPRSFFAKESGFLAVALEDFRRVCFRRISAILLAGGKKQAAFLVAEEERSVADTIKALKNAVPNDIVRLLKVMEPIPAEEKLLDPNDPKVREGLQWMRNTKVRWLKVAAEETWQRLYETKGETAMHRTLFLKEVPLFSALSLDELLEVEKACHDEEYLEGETIFKEGSVGDRFYIVFLGEVRIEREGRELLVAGPGQYFGEMALFEGEPRSATAVAKTSCLLLSLEQSDFHSLITSRPRVLLHICAELSRRLRQQSARLS